MKIYLDFDGTVVRHEFPKIGQYNEGAFDVLKKLIAAGHEIILNTYRVEVSKESLVKAKVYLRDGLGVDIESIKHTTFKFHPGYWDVGKFKEIGAVYIDDIGENHPVKDGMIDWVVVDAEFESHGIYKT